MKSQLCALLASLAVLVPLAARAEVQWAPEELGHLNLDLIQRLETKIEMPTGTHPIAAYVRYYTTMREGANVVVVGFFSLSADPSVHIVSEEEELEEMDAVHDGGCGRVTVWFDIRSLSLIAAWCNGVA